jgi:hypothetical protein
MSRRLESGMVLFMLALTVFLATSVRAQEALAKSSSDSTPRRETSTSSKTKQKPSLLDATRVSTEEAAKRAAPKSADKAAEASADESVTEFHPTRVDSAQTGGAIVTTSDESKKSVLKRVHGTVHGSAAAGTSGDRGGGASVGAASKSGKTAIYVETDHSRRDTPH